VLSRPFLTLAFAMFTATMGIGMVTPILSVYAESQGATGAEIGLAFSSFAITQLLISPFSGRLADRYGRKIFIVAGLASYVVTALGWYYTDSVYWTIAFRAFSGIGSAVIFSLSQAYIGDLAPSGYEGRYMGVFGIFMAVGFGIGPLLAGVVRDQTDIETVFLSMAVMFAAATVIVFVALPRSKRISHGEEGAPAQVPWSTILRHPYVQGLYLVGTSLAFAMGASFTFVAIFLENELAATGTMVGAVLAVQQVTAGAMQPVSGMLADRFNRRLLIAAGAALVAVGYLVPSMVDSYWVILAAFMVGVGVGSSVAQVSTQALQVDIGRGLGMATVMSLQSTSFGSGILLGATLTGFVNDAIGTRAVFVAASIAIAVGAVAFLVRTAGRRPTRFEEGEAPRTVAEAASG
jgi:MFS family permease